MRPHLLAEPVDGPLRVGELLPRPCYVHGNALLLVDKRLQAQALVAGLHCRGLTAAAGTLGLDHGPREACRGGSLPEGLLVSVLGANDPQLCCHLRVDHGEHLIVCGGAGGRHFGVGLMVWGTSYMPSWLFHFLCEVDWDLIYG